MFQLNLEAISEQGLAPMVAVTNKYDMLYRCFVISSIADDGAVYFKGGNGSRAWSRNLVRVAQTDETFFLLGAKLPVTH